MALNYFGTGVIILVVGIVAFFILRGYFSGSGSNNATNSWGIFNAPDQATRQAEYQQQFEDDQRRFSGLSLYENDPSSKGVSIGGSRGFYMSRGKQRIVAFLIFVSLMYSLYQIEYHGFRMYS